MAPVSNLGRGKPLKNQTKEVLHKIYKYFEKEIERDPNSTVTASQLVVHSTGISMNALKRVLVENKTNAKVKRENKKPRRRWGKNLVPDDYEAQSIRRIIHSFYNKDEEFPVMKDLLLVLKADIDYQGSLCTLRKHIAKLGFRWTETLDSNCILVEKHDCRFTRIQYLTTLDPRHFRSQGRNIVYTADLAIESNRLSSKPKPDGSSVVLKQPAKSNLITLLAGDLQSIYKNTLYLFDGKKDYKEEVEIKRENLDQYEKWYKYHLLPTLKPNSVVVVDSGSYHHNWLVNSTPHSNSRKRELMDWLNSRNVPYSANMFKPQLYQLVLLNRDRFNEHKIDTLLRENGHTVLRMPAYHPDLNPIKNVLSIVRDYVGRDTCLKLESVNKIINEKLSSLTVSEWKEQCRLAEVEENILKTTERVLDDISERSLKNIDEGSDYSDMDEDNATDQESMESD